MALTMAYSPTYNNAAKTVTKWITELASVFSTDVSSISNKLLVKGIISKDSHNKIREGSPRNAKEKAEELVSCIVDHIQEKPDIFDTLLRCLEEDLCFKDIAEKLKQNFGKQLLSLSIIMVLFSCSCM